MLIDHEVHKVHARKAKRPMLFYPCLALLMAVLACAAWLWALPA